MNKRDFYFGILLGTVMSIYGNIWVNYVLDISRCIVREDVWYGAAAPIALLFSTFGLVFIGHMLWNEAKNSRA